MEGVEIELMTLSGWTACGDRRLLEGVDPMIYSFTGREEGPKPKPLAQGSNSETKRWRVPAPVGMANQETKHYTHRFTIYNISEAETRLSRSQKAWNHP